MKRLQKLAAVLLTAALALTMLTACSGGGSLDAKAEKDQQQIIADVNTVRTQNGLNALQENESANEIARQLAEAYRQRYDGKITSDEWDAKDSALCKISVEGRRQKGYYGLNGPNLYLNLSYWQDVYANGQTGASNTAIVKNEETQWIGVAVLEEPKGQNIRYTAFVVTY